MLVICSEFVLEAFCSLLRRIDLKESLKAKGNATVSVLAANLLMASYKNVAAWPEMFVR